MNYSEVKSKWKYFAAANGYNGFKSYFNDVFNPSKYSQIYILKGGPGTGKSSLMKKLESAFYGKVMQTEAIFCSSDPSSLDGIILKNNGKSIAVIDGTNPHATDPLNPGAIETIINLGEGWDTELLRSNRSKIEVINRKKAHHYRSAYEYLSVCGRLTEICDNETFAVYQKDNADIEKIICDIPAGEGKTECKITSSFGKDGFGRTNCFENNSKFIYSVVGIYGSEYIFMRNLLNRIRNREINFIFSPSPFDEEKTDAILFPDTECAVICRSEKTADKIIDTARFINADAMKSSKEKIEFLWSERESFLWGAADEFKRASDEHFRLEKIYSAAKDFSKNDALFLQIYDECERILLK